MLESAVPGIRTPDQRLRIFVSSTLKELEPERRAARTAIERLRLAPVMFELGARPHPPQQLYRAYLEQSDVFVGIYWEHYGWIAPDEEISGLEDEYRLAPAEMPKLIYLKQPAEREPRLAELLGRIRDDDTASYTPFSTVEELAELIESDLAILLAERFDASRGPATQEVLEAPAATDHIPVPYTDAVGREQDVATLLDWLADDAQRIVTLVGPGRHRQEPARDRGRAKRRRAVRPGDLRDARARARSRRRAARDRPGARRARHRRPTAQRAARRRTGRTTRPHRARQLRAGAHGRVAT